MAYSLFPVKGSKSHNCWEERNLISSPHDTAVPYLNEKKFLGYIKSKLITGDNIITKT